MIFTNKMEKKEISKKQVIYIAAIYNEKNDGIFQKVISQSAALSIINGSCSLYSMKKDGISLIFFSNGVLINEISINNKIKSDSYLINYIYFCKSLFNDLKKSSHFIFYVRHLHFNLHILFLFFILKRRNNYLIYEIPTFPYFYEQLNVSIHKFKTLIALLFDKLFLLFIFKIANTIPVILCNDKIKLNKKMIRITNGYIDNKFIISESLSSDNNNNDFNIIGIGTLYKYHGYREFIDNLNLTNGYLLNGKKIVLYIIGSSEYYDQLKVYSAKLKIKDHIIFLGSLPHFKVLEYYRIANLGLGTLRLDLRRANIDTSIKTLDYFKYQVPILTSGLIMNFPVQAYKVVNLLVDQVSFEDLYTFSLLSKSIFYSPLLKQRFQWDKILLPVFNKIYDN
jgi:glycosyltransferase involved in cell wall biosynthesis